MKKITTLGIILFSITILSSCGNNDSDSDKDKKKDKFKKEIKEPCDILEYTIDISEKLEDLADDYDDIDDLEDNKKDRKKADEYFDELADAWKYAFKKFDANEMNGIISYNSDCRNRHEMDDALDEIEDFYEERWKEFQGFIGEEIDNDEAYGYAEEAVATENHRTVKSVDSDKAANYYKAADAAKESYDLYYGEDESEDHNHHEY